METAAKVGLGVGVVALVAGTAWLLLREKPAKASEETLPGGTATPPPDNTTSVVIRDAKGYVDLLPGNMGTLRVKHPSLVGIRAEEQVTGFKSSNESVLAMKPLGTTASQVFTKGTGSAVLDVEWERSAERGGGLVTSKITLVVE